MNQIPNINHIANGEDRLLVHNGKVIPNIEEVERKKKVLESTACCRACFRQRKQLVDEIIQELEQTLHHQLQKARHDWLREEIVRLEGMKEDGETPLGTQELHETELAYNQALQTIIDRYHSELDQDTPKE